MRPTTSGSKLTNPFNYARLLHVLGPFLDVIMWGRTMPKKLAKMHDTAVWYCEKPHVVSGLEQKLLYHQNLREELDEADVQGKLFVVLPGMSIDNTAMREGLFPGKTGLDILHESYRLGNEIGRIVQGIYAAMRVRDEDFDDAMKDIVFLPMTDMILPVVYDHTGVSHLLPEAVEQTNIALENAGKREFGEAEKTYGFTQARNDFSDTLLESEVAHRIYEPKYADLIRKVQDGQRITDGALRRLLDLFKKKELTEEDLVTVPPDQLFEADNTAIKRKVTKVVAYNLQLMANAYASFFALSHPQEVIPFVKKSSYVHKVLERVSRLHPVRVTEAGKKGVMKNASKSLYGECDPSALRILEGFLCGEMERRLGKRARGTVYNPVREYVKPAKEREMITACGVNIQTIGESSAARYLRNEFTVEDVREMLRGAGMDPADAEEEYKELRFSEEELRELKNDTERERYVLPGSIHHDLEELSSGKDFLVYLINNENHYLTRSWMAMHGKARVYGLPTADADFRPYQMRASEFSATCHIARLISKMDTEKLGVDDKNRFSIVGTATHRLWNTRPWLDYPERGTGPHVAEFCEKRLAYTRVVDGEEVTILGSADGIAVVESKSGDYMMILDRKRANYFKQSFVFQTMTYNQAVMQMMQETLLSGLSLKEFNGYFTVINKRPFVSVIQEPVMPHLVIGYASPNAAEEVRLKEVKLKDMKPHWVIGLENVLRNNLMVQRRLVNEEGFLEWYKFNTAKNGGCRFGGGIDCLNKKKCDTLTEKIVEGNSLGDFFFPSVDL